MTKEEKEVQIKPKTMNSMEPKKPALTITRPYLLTTTELMLRMFMRLHYHYDAEMYCTLKPN